MENSFDRAHRLARVALEFVMAHGLVRYRKDGSVGHLPFSLHPWAAPPGFYGHSKSVCSLYNKLYHRVSRQREFLDQHLSASRAVDSFIQGLYSCLPERPIERPWMYINRHDFMPAQSAGGVLPKQVETNLMAASLGYASQRVNAALRFLYADTDLGPRIPAHRGGSTTARGLAELYKRVATPGQVVLFIIPEGESNAFDQRAMQAELVLELGVPVLPTTLDEIGREGKIVDGKVSLHGKSAAVAYLRAGYSPDHYGHADAWAGRKLIEHSETISIPSVTIQLANTKKIQQVLTQRAELERFVSPDEAARLQQTMVAMSAIDAPWEGGTAREAAMADPESWVLKPSREGGGNNYFGADIPAHLGALNASDAEAFVLMEAIRQQPFRGVRMVDGEVVDGEVVTELGFFTTALFENDESPAFEEVEGYLLRTKDVANREGLVLGGYSYLDSVLLEQPE